MQMMNYSHLRKEKKNNDEVCWTNWTNKLLEWSDLSQ